jgi:hypothetical protein
MKKEDPKIKIEFGSIVAKRRQLKARWTVEARSDWRWPRPEALVINWLEKWKKRDERIKKS